MLTESDATSPAAFLKKIVAAELLDGYGQGVASLPESSDIPTLTPELWNYIRTSSGREDVRVWANTFRTTLADLLAFRADLAHNPASVSLADVQTANEVGDKIFTSLVDWLESSPALKAS